MNLETWNNMQSDVDDHSFTQERQVKGGTNGVRSQKKWKHMITKAADEDGGSFSFTVIDIAANEIIIPYSRVCSSQTS